MIRLPLLFVFIITSHTAFTQINPENIEIVRDSFGIPFVYAPTNAEAAYGVAWAQCEDNFNIMQETFAAARGKTGTLLGPDGAVIDFIMQMFQISEFVESRYEQDVSPEYDAILTAYAEGVNRYAELHPEEVLLKGLGNIKKHEILEIFVLNFLVNNNAVLDIAKVMDNKMDLYPTLGRYQGGGSNAMAYSPLKTTDGRAYLVGNPHQPIDGPASFWEVGIKTDEGLDIFGATFVAGGITPFIAVTPNFAWTHTTNYDDYSDVFELKMHPKNKNLYEYDGEWLELEKHHAKLRVKIGPIVLPIKKKYYRSVYGPTAKNKSGVFAFRNNAFFNIKTAEQWYRMGLAQNFDEFQQAIDIQGIPCQTITYADKDGNIFHDNNALMPVRSSDYEWRGLVPGNTSATMWSYDTIMPREMNVRVVNPQAGYVFDANSTPFDATAANENPKPDDYPATFGLMTSNTHRAKRFKYLIDQHEKVSFEDIKAIRDDEGYHPTDIGFRNAMDLNILFELPSKYPDLHVVDEHLKKWDWRMNVENKHAAFMAVMTMYLQEFISENFALYENTLPEEKYVEGLRFARDFLLKHYGTLEVPLGDVQKIVRGDKELPMYGSTNTLANCHLKKHGKNKVQMKHGDTFIMYAGFGEDGLELLKTVNLFGNSWKPDSPHYDDQMELLVNKQTKDISLDKETVYKNAVRVYHPK